MCSKMCSMRRNDMKQVEISNVILSLHVFLKKKLVMKLISFHGYSMSLIAD